MLNHRAIKCQWCGTIHTTCQSATKFCSRKCKEAAREKRKRTQRQLNSQSSSTTEDV